jgi:ribosomal protein S18 acetylase RimI-like enzyme
VSEPRLAEDAWLSAKLGKPAFHLIGGFDGIKAKRRDLAVRLNGRLFADAKVPVGDVAAAAAVQALGFMLIDTNLHFTLSRAGVRDWNGAGDVGFAKPDMAESVGVIAGQNFQYDRFHRDPVIGSKTADRLKCDWARNFFSGERGDWMVVACVDGKPAGFLQLLRAPRDELVIDLIAVAAPYQRKGVARTMIAFAAIHCRTAGPIMVGTQVSNLPSVRLYEGMGFRIEKAQYIFHHHGAV